MAGNVDLHMHTTHSDGTWEVSRLLEVVRQSDLVAFSITDHDTLAGYREAIGLLQPDDPELVPGLEMSVAVGDSDMHMLAYFVDAENDALNRAIIEFGDERNRRGERIVEQLNDLGLNLPLEAVIQEAAGSALARPHIAQAMVDKGLVDSFEGAFRKYIGNKGPAYIPKSKLAPKDAIDLVHAAGGVAVMAHPYINGMHNHVIEMAGLGLDGIEAYHYSHSNGQVREIKRLAKKNNLLLSGGSDFHGRMRYEAEIGAAEVPCEYLEALRDRAKEIRG